MKHPCAPLPTPARAAGVPSDAVVVGCRDLDYVSARAAGRHGDCGGPTGTRCVLPVCRVYSLDALGSQTHGEECWVVTRRPAPGGCTGRVTATACGPAAPCRGTSDGAGRGRRAVAGSPAHCGELFGLPRIDPAPADPGRLVQAVPDWDRPPDTGAAVPSPPGCQDSGRARRSAT